jgi:hypothetical protein
LCFAFALSKSHTDAPHATVAISHHSQVSSAVSHAMIDEQPAEITTTIEQPPPHEWCGKLLNGATWRVKQGDAFKTLKSMEKNSVDCVITSPPYFWLRNYHVEGQIGLEESVDAYVKQITRVMTQVFLKFR